VGPALVSDFLIPELKFIDLSRAQEGFVDFGLCETKPNRSEAFRMRSPSLNGKGDEENRFGEVAASPNSQNLTESGIKAGIEEIDVLFLFGVGDEPLHRSLSTWLKKEEGRFLVFIEEREEFFLRGKNLPFASDPGVRFFYWKRGDEAIFQRIAWEFVFLRFGYAVSEPHFKGAAQDFFILLEHYHRGVDLLGSDSEDMGIKVLSNVMENLSLLPKARLGSSLEGKCAGIPAIICGAGPSLDHAAPLLSALKEKALMIGGGSSVRALNAHGISPHIFASIDPHPPYRRFLEQECFEIPFFYQGRFCHSLLERVQAPLVLMPDSGSYPLEGWLAAEFDIFAECFDAGWTVANFCTSLAAHLGCSPIILIGMDFSCGPTDIYASKIGGEENRNALIELKKDTLYSKRDWLMSAEWTGSFAKKNPHIQWINASRDGIDLPGIEYRELSEVAEIMLTGEFDMAGIVHALIHGASPSQVSSEKVDNVRKKVKESFEKCLEICDGLLKVWEKHYPDSPLERGEYAILDIEFEQQICYRHFLLPLWNVWKHPILRTTLHPLGQHLHRLLFFKKAIEMHLPHLRSFS
jgi:hypothetical protein